MSIRAPTTEHRLRALSRRMHAPHWIIVGFAACILLAGLNELYERLSVLAFLVPRLLDNSPALLRLISTEIGTLIAHMSLLALLCILGYIYVMRQNAGVDSALYEMAGSKARKIIAQRPQALEVEQVKACHWRVWEGATPYSVWQSRGVFGCACNHPECKHIKAVWEWQKMQPPRKVSLVPEQKKASG